MGRRAGKGKGRFARTGDPYGMGLSMYYNHYSYVLRALSQEMQAFPSDFSLTGSLYLFL
jgi:hypothetical protein